MPQPLDRLGDLRRDLDAAAARGAGRHEVPPRLLTLPESLRCAMVRVKPSALIGAAVLLVLVLAIVGVRTAWAQRAAEPVPVATTRSVSADQAEKTGEASAGSTGAEPSGSPREPTAAGAEPGASGEPGAKPGASGSPGAEPVESAYVHVIGAVRKPGVVQVPLGSRVSDVVDAAGGLKGDADLSRINLARVVVDAERIWIPIPGDEPPTEVGATEPTAPSAPTAADGAPAADSAAAGETEQVQIDLNAADSTTLQTLPGVGPVTAESILTWRTENGGFNTIDELLEVSGIGPATLDKLRPRVVVGGP